MIWRAASKSIAKLLPSWAPVSNRDGKIRLDGVPLALRLVYYLLHKPQGIVSTTDPSGRPRVIVCCPACATVVHGGAVGSVERGSDLLTNDGELAQRLAHPRFGVEDVSRARCRLPGTEVLAKLRQGVHLAEGFAKVQSVRVRAGSSRHDAGIVLAETQSRIRRILANSATRCCD
jgi:23S rRNA pseudouridine2605 synthase